MTDISNLTYQTIITTVTNFIKTNCVNISNFNNISSVHKDGYTATAALPGGNAVSTCYYTIKITANSISQVSSITVDNDFNSFLLSIGITNKNEAIGTDKFIYFVCLIIKFCCNHMRFNISQYTTAKYLIYYQNNNVSYNISDYVITTLLKAKNISIILDIIIALIKSSTKCYPCKYTITYS